MNEEMIRIFKTASLCRNFELEVFNNIKRGIIRIPVYLSAGHEFISATLANQLKHKNPMIFAQHRAHHTYISFGGDINGLICELLGRKNGCCKGMGGSASIQSKEISMFGHDGLMGSQIPIAVGACFSSKRFTMTFCGDASVEEDYVMSSIAWAGHKKLPMLFIVEDNNLSILTEKSIRRSWKAHEFSKSVNVDGYDISDDPNEILKTLSSIDLNKPNLININTTRLWWHAGAGEDTYYRFDRYANIKETGGKVLNDIDSESKQYIELLWKKQLETQLKA